MDNHCHQSIHHPSTVTVNGQFSIAKPLKYWKVGDYKPTNIIKRGSLGQHSDSPGKWCEAVQRFWDFSGIKLNAPVGRPWNLYLRIWLSASGTLLCWQLFSSHLQTTETLLEDAKLAKGCDRFIEHWVVHLKVSQNIGCLQTYFLYYSICIYIYVYIYIYMCCNIWKQCNYL